MVASAILGAPGFLSGLTDTELTFVKHKNRAARFSRDSPRAATLKALEQAEAGWQRAIDKIGERAGLTKIPDGAWRDPLMSEAA